MLTTTKLTPSGIVRLSMFNKGPIGHFVKRHGRFFQPQILPRPFRRREPKACFKNAYALATQQRLLIYVEGFAISENVGDFAHLHAWCVDASGNVLDPTWKVGAAYFGVPFRTDFLRRVIAERSNRGETYYGLIDDWQRNYLLVNELAHKPDLWLADLGEMIRS